LGGYIYRYTPRRRCAPASPYLVAFLTYSEMLVEIENDPFFGPRYVFGTPVGGDPVGISPSSFASETTVHIGWHAALIERRLVQWF